MKTLARPATYFILTVVFILSFMGCSKTPQEEGPIAITNAVIIDGNGGQPIEGGTVVIEEDKIQAVGSSNSVEIPPNAKIIDATGKSVTPGLADMHVHLVGGWDGVSTDILGYQRYLNSLLYCGVTTVMDVGNFLPFSLQIRDEILAGRIPGPRIYTSGPLIDGPNPYWPDISFTVTSPEQIPRFVKKLKNQGVDFLKAYADLTYEQLIEIVKEGKKVGLQVVCHHPHRLSNEELVDSGVAASAHTFTKDISLELISKMKENAFAVITTLAVFEVFSLERFNDKSFLNHSLVQDTTPPWFLEKIVALEPKEPRPTEQFKNAQANTKQMFDAGVHIVGGTDAPYPGVFQGEGIHRELELLVEAGLTPLQAITVVTKNAAILMQAEHEWGTITQGKKADLLIINGRPDQNISESRNVETVIQMGKILDRESLKFDVNKDPGFRISSSIDSK
ncbi:amidohydrolase family protein [Acidobacteriota bacterium]